MKNKKMLTPFQHRLIMNRVLEGQSFEAIAKKYMITYKGVMYHFRQIYRVLDIHDSAFLYSAYRRYISSDRILIEIGLETPAPSETHLLN